MYDEIERYSGNVSDFVTGNFQAASVRAHRTNSRLYRDLRTARKLACRNYRIRRDFIAAERWIAGRIRRPAGDPRVPRFAQRRAPKYLPHPDVRPRHKPGERKHGWV